MSLGLLKKLQRHVLFSLILALPLTGMPERFSVPGMGGNLSYIFAFIGVALIVYHDVWHVIAMKGLLVAGLSGKAFVILNGIVWGLLFCKLEEIKIIRN